MDWRAKSPHAPFLSVNNYRITATPVIYMSSRAAFVLRWAELSSYNRSSTVREGFFTFAVRPFVEVCHPCSGACVLSHCPDLQRPGLLLLLPVPRLPYPSAHSTLPVFLAQGLKCVPSSYPHGHCLTSGSCKLWPGLIKYPVASIPGVKYPLASIPGPWFFLNRRFPVSSTSRPTWKYNIICTGRWGKCSWLLEAGGG